MFSIATLNPARLIDTSDINYGFDGNFAVLQVLDYQSPKCYFQKWQLSDVLKLQVLSDFVPTDLLICSVDTDLVVEIVEWIEKPTIIVDQTFKVYELEFEFVTLPPGRYYYKFEYTDENDFVHPMQSEGIDVQLSHPNTILLQYKNSINDFDTIFDTGIVFNFRVESAIKDYSPGNARNIYNDQRVNPTLLSATPFRKFKFYIGYQYGVPAWVMDKVNRIQSVDQVKYNNIYYQIVEGSDYEIETNDNNNFLGGSIDVQPTDNNFSRYSTLPSDEDGELIYVMGKRSDHFNVSDNFNVAGVFKAASLLEQVLVTKRAPIGVLTMKIGTTPGGSEIGEFDVDDSKFVQTTPYFFSASTTLYLTGLEDADADITFLYLQTDAPPIDLGSIVPAPIINIGKNAMMFYEETMPGELDLDFDVSTGLGRTNTKYDGWAICDGRNGTEDWKGRTPVVQDLEDPDFATLKDVGGEKAHALTTPEGPEHDHTYNRPRTDTIGSPYEGNSMQGGSNRGLWTGDTVSTGKSGAGAPHNNMQPYLVTLLIKKIS